MSAGVIAKNISVTFGQSVVLDDLTVELQPGEIVGLIGPSGAGKSTFINALLGMIKLDSGSVEVFGNRMPNREVMEKIGFMAQSDALFPELTGQQNLEFFGNLQGIAKKELVKSLTRAVNIVNLTDKLNQPVSTYSGGMKRRLSLAIVLQTDAPFIVLDEPTVGIDPELRQEIWKELRSQAAAGKTILVTTHAMDEAERCDYLLLLRAGKFVGQGSPAKLKEEFDVASIEEAFIVAGQSNSPKTRVREGGK